MSSDQIFGLLTADCFNFIFHVYKGSAADAARSLGLVQVGRVRVNGQIHTHLSDFDSSGEVRLPVNRNSVKGGQDLAHVVRWAHQQLGSPSGHGQNANLRWGAML